MSEEAGDRSGPSLTRIEVAHLQKYRRYDTTLAGGVNHRLGRKQAIQARRADTHRFCVGPSGLGHVYDTQPAVYTAG